MDTRFDFAKEEQKIYEQWESTGCFKPETEGQTWKSIPTKNNFCIILPPPNANADLHLGHAMYVIEDIMIRFHRMKGDATLWLPGADHAGFETQYVYEKWLAKQGKSRFDFDRETLFKNIWDFVQNNREKMEDQLRRLGFSLDWTRKKFTLDPEIQKIVYETFKRLYDEGLIYRGERLVNYCTKCGTSFSDLEVKHEEVEGKLWFIKYLIVDSVGARHGVPLQNKFIVVATTRPETMLGDTAIAVHPDDKRYTNLVGKTAILPILNREIPIISDETVDPKFGTGAVKITPAHDENDLEIGRRHHLPSVQVISFSGRISAHIDKPFGDMKVRDARGAILQALQEQNLIEKEENYKHTVSKCYKCGSILEPLPLPQWYVKVAPLAKSAIEKIETGEIKFYPARYKEQAIAWLKNFHDWNISRQIVWGMRIPAWQCLYCQEIRNSKSEIRNNVQNPKVENQKLDPRLRGDDKTDDIRENPLEISEDPNEWIVTDGQKPGKCPKCGSTDLIQDPDTFDTWFSSGQWPFATLLSPPVIPAQAGIQSLSPSKSRVLDSRFHGNDKGECGDFSRFYPTSVMETGYDILPWWVCRMIMLGIYATGAVPFKNVYLHGLVRDSKGQKMSKSKGNVVNPLDMTDKYGADALRASLIFGIGQGADVPFSEDRVRAMRNFTTKLWNIGRFLLSNLDSHGFDESQSGQKNINIKPDNELGSRTDSHGSNEIDDNDHIRENPLSIRVNPEATEPPFYTKEMAGMNNDDKKIIQELEMLIKKVTQNIESFEFSQALDMVYEFVWHRFADWYIEAVKERLKNGDMAALSVLRHVFLNSLILLHPFTPFVTEALWDVMSKKSETMLIVSQWPDLSD